MVCIYVAIQGAESVCVTTEAPTTTVVTTTQGGEPNIPSTKVRTPAPVTTPAPTTLSTTAEDTCQHNYGRRLKASVPVTFISTLNTPTTGTDPIPCCSACARTAGCNYYYLEYKSGADAQCTLYGLDASLRIDLLLGKLYEKGSFPGFCIGYTNRFLDL